MVCVNTFRICSLLSTYMHKNYLILSHYFYLSCSSCPSACNLTGCQSNSVTECWDMSGPGGGGSGGSIYLTAKYVKIGKF